MQCCMFLLDTSKTSLKVWPQSMTSLWGLNRLSCIARSIILCIMRFFLFLSQKILCDLWLKVRWPAWLHSLSVFHKKDYFLSQWPWIKASYDKSWRTVTVWTALSNSCYDAYRSTQRWFTFRCVSLGHLMSGNHMDLLRKYQHIWLRHSLSYRTETSGVSCKEREIYELQSHQNS